MHKALDPGTRYGRPLGPNVYVNNAINMMIGMGTPRNNNSSERIAASEVR